MQTFLPYPDLAASAQCLDDKRLGNQRREAITLLGAIHVYSPNGWKNHPAAKMWRGYDQALRQYLREVCLEWKRRGFDQSFAIPGEQGEFRKPWWLGIPTLHSSHRGALLYKNPAWYRQFGWAEKPRLDYYWPVA